MERKTPKQRREDADKGRTRMIDPSARHLRSSTAVSHAHSDDTHLQHGQLIGGWTNMDFLAARHANIPSTIDHDDGCASFC